MNKYLRNAVLLFSVLFFMTVCSCLADPFPSDFIIGADISELAAQEKSGVIYFDADGSEKDALEILSSYGVNHIRLRVWNDPFDADGGGYGGGNINAETAAGLSARGAVYGLKTLLDFHYSDFWADPSRQLVPKAWRGMTLSQKADALYEYTRESLALIFEAGGDVDMVQVGNEINNDMAGESDPAAKAMLVAAGCRAVREFAASRGKDIRIAVHLTDPQDPDRIFELLKSFTEAGAEFDAVGLSYYPYWHGSLSNLASVISVIRTDFAKDVFIAEISWPFTLDDGDFSGNVIGTDPGLYDLSADGQVRCIYDLCQTAVNAGALGFYYWGSIWTPVGSESRAGNLEKWEKFGSGWATRFAHSYDPDHVENETDGCAWDNQAMFDFEGHPLPVLTLCRDIADGTIETDPDFIPDGENEPYAAADMSQNLVLNPDFEDDDLSMWVPVSMTDDIPYDYQKKSNDAHSGVMAFHYWSPNDMDFYIEQTISGLEPGLYEASVWSQGGDMKNAAMDLYVVMDEENIASVSFMNTTWADWQHPVLPVEIKSDTVIIGVHIVCGAKSWGTLDDFSLVKVR